MLKSFSVEGETVEGCCRLRWKPVAAARSYAVEWLGEGGDWSVLWDVEGEEAAPREGGFVEYVDECPGSAGPGGTYRVTASCGSGAKQQCVTSPPVKLAPREQVRAVRGELAQRLARKEFSERTTSVILPLK